MWCSLGHALPKQQDSWIFHLLPRGGVDFRAASYSIFDYASISACIVKEFCRQ
jgi:hypothetical protein